MLDLLFIANLGALERLVEAVAARVVLPSVISAADAVVFDKAVEKRRAAMRAVLGDETIAAAAVAIEDEVFA
jgi:hypothetical protein